MISLEFLWWDQRSPAREETSFSEASRSIPATKTGLTSESILKIPRCQARQAIFNFQEKSREDLTGELECVFCPELLLRVSPVQLGLLKLMDPATIRRITAVTFGDTVCLLAVIPRLTGRLFRLSPEISPSQVPPVLRHP